MSIQFKTINELSHMLKNKDISNKELIEETFSLIDTNTHLNAFVTLNKDASLLKAEELDKNPSPLALAGIPVAQKDLFCTKDLRTTCGSNMLSSFIPPYSATVLSLIHI